ncbi:hypothetical protein Pmar_PMAR023009 [Perkinsus marinus ATCC 50983]|uniref:Uncharacterized protein n=1 Tax=Perkinsus marinus (strain ATCC 50983 / TXsc) TaxID=423536 RepID=C5LHV8_PERM5|nr:hypothetical protein Pmar_PMAR023009 [Perkinsus marinus ATCC 50983]EER03712.1 hypothetical protein Pmar_PMAR023009 [Perkinsus marinus ATCC 50983]|eukprot:XP_002771896.1 hypothetical protein Pmar_PMAR023009 [Perkinsus marinus ATCC 50983]
METLTEALVQNAISGMRGGGLLPERVGPGEVARVLCPGIVPSGALDDAAVESNLILTIRLLARTKGAGETATQTIIPLARVCSEPLSSRPLELSSRVKRLLPPVHRRDLAGAISALQIGVYMQDTDIIETLMKTVHGSVRLTERDLAVAHFCVLKFATTKSREILNTLRGLCSVEVDRTGEFIAEFLIALDLTHSLAVTKLLSMLDEEVVNLKGRAPMLEYADYLPAGASVAHLLLVCFDRGIGGVCEVLPHVMARWQAQLALQQLDLGPVDVQCLDLVGTAPLLRCLQPLRLTVGVGEGTSCLVDEMMKYGARRSFAIMAMYRHLGRRVRAQPRAGCRCKVCTRWLALPLDIEPLIWANLARIAQGDDDEVNRAEWIKYDRSQQLNELLVYRDEGVDDDQTVLMKMEMLIDEGADPNIPLEGSRKVDVARHAIGYFL